MLGLLILLIILMIVLRAMTATGTVLYKAMCAMLSRANQSSSKKQVDNYILNLLFSGGTAIAIAGAAIQSVGQAAGLK